MMMTAFVDRWASLTSVCTYMIHHSFRPRLQWKWGSDSHKCSAFTM